MSARLLIFLLSNSILSFFFGKSGAKNKEKMPLHINSAKMCIRTIYAHRAI